MDNTATLKFDLSIESIKVIPEKEQSLTDLIELMQKLGNKIKQIDYENNCLYLKVNR